MNQLTLFEQQVVCDDFTNDDYETPNWLSKAMANLILPTIGDNHDTTSPRTAFALKK
jgi:hypothetical protein